MGRGQPITIETIPDDHRRMKGHYSGVTEDGTEFDLVVETGTRRAQGHALIKLDMNARARGRMLTTADMQVEYTELYVLVGHTGRKPIRINPNGSYGYGPMHSRTLRGIVGKIVEEYAPTPRPKADTPRTPGM